MTNKNSPRDGVPPPRTAPAPLDVVIERPPVQYPIVVGAGLAGERRAWLAARAAGGQAIVVTDTNVASAGWADVVAREIGLGEGPSRRLVVPAGESSKTMDTVLGLVRGALHAGLDRHGVWIALGGGVVADLAGLAASLFMRGTDVVQLPTSLLAMVDASVGGKTGVDLPEGKNLVGTFHQPLAVLADVECLATLPEAEVGHGLAEVVKHAWIADAGLLATLERLDGAAALLADAALAADIVTRAVTVKATIVRQDEHDAGPRQLLNFGHTVGHALEAATGYTVPHGAAVAIGMVAETHVACAVGVCRDAGAAARLEQLLHRLGLPRATSARWIEDTLRRLAFDKKRHGPGVRLALPERPGHARIVDGVPPADIKAVLRHLWT